MLRFCGKPGFPPFQTADHRVEIGHEQQRGDRADHHAADDGACEDCILLFAGAPIAIGSIPTTIAAAVISTGRRRVVPADKAAWKALAPAWRCSRANVTSRIEFAEATPIAMIAPISDGTLSVVPVTNSINRIPAPAPGNARMTANGSRKL